MLLKKILPVFAIAGIATAAPVEDLEARATGGTCGQYSNAWCCATAFPFSVFFIQQVGSNCVKPSGTTSPYSCANKPGKTNFLCCAGNQITDNKGGVVCTV
ncbi:hypothetical protein N7493_004563 [Penicillium malachiteum]|uniref:Hydrophobin n=1 Tax=Penicillium malachiteum TaxID=1324776 RepID=A0AAD6MX59_9EURO|nr:hypothetical protein N7493_004563 [Penicillium malachiteum]